MGNALKRREFIKNAAAIGLVTFAGIGKTQPAMAKEIETPMGRPLGMNETLLIHNAKPIDVTGAKLFDETAILVRGYKIEKRVPASEVAETKADRKIDAGGRYIIPGLINTHVHITMPCVGAYSPYTVIDYGAQADRNCVDCVKNGVTTVRDQLGHQGMIVKRQERITRGELMGPRILRGIALQVPHGYGTEFPSWVVKNGLLIVRNVSEAKDAIKKAIDPKA